MSDDLRQLALPVDLGSWPPRRPDPVAPLTAVERNEFAESTFALAGVGPPAVGVVAEPAMPAPEFGTVETSMDVVIKVTEPDRVREIGCECDLRQRRWNPNTGKCETCGSRYFDVEVGIHVTPAIANEPVEVERTCWPSGSGASFSDDRVYRFELWRDTGLEYGPKGGAVAVIIGVNPSDANEIKNDPTITKDVEFARRWGCAHVLKVNANAFVATDPDDMRKAFAQGVDIVGPDNDGVIRRACGVALLSKGKLVPAWGKNITPKRQKEIYETIIRYCGVQPMCLGINKDGTPKHTGRISYETALVPWTCP